MATLDDAVQLLSKLQPAEKLELFYEIATDSDVAEPGIHITPGVCGGSPCIRLHRLPVWLLEAFRRDGSTDRELLERYEFLTPDDLRNAWNFVAKHPTLIDREIRENDEDPDGVEATGPR